MDEAKMMLGPHEAMYEGMTYADLKRHALARHEPEMLTALHRQWGMHGLFDTDGTINAERWTAYQMGNCGCCTCKGAE